MELEFTDEQDELRATARAFLERECPPRLVRDIVEKGVDANGLWEQMVALGWPALTVPDAQGGLGLGFVELAVVLEELGRVAAPGPFLATVTQFVPAVRHAGNAEQHERFLGAVASGAMTGTLAVAEETGSWRPADVRLTARKDGGSWVLDGEKRYVIDGDRADEVAVAARTDGGVRLFVVPRADIKATPVEAFDRSRPMATLTFTGTVVPEDRALGAPGDASVALGRAVEEATVALALETVGTCQTIFDVALDYARQREQFGVPIGSFQAIKHKFADMLVALERGRAAAWFGALTIAEDDERRTVAASMAKAAAGDCQRRLAQEGIQVLGGIGYTWEHDMHLYVKRVKSADALFGTAAQHRQRVADLMGV